MQSTGVAPAVFVDSPKGSAMPQFLERGPF